MLEFDRALLREAHKEVKQRFPQINLRKDAWVWRFMRQHWEFHGPDNFYWHGSACSAYEARAKGWSAWLDAQDRKAEGSKQ